MVITMLSNQPKAKEFRRWAVGVLKNYRNEQTTLTHVLPLQHDKFLESMVKEAGKGNLYAKTVLHQRYGLEPHRGKIVRCDHCGGRVDVELSLPHSGYDA